MEFAWRVGARVVPKLERLTRNLAFLQGSKTKRLRENNQHQESNSEGDDMGKIAIQKGDINQDITKPASASDPDGRFSLPVDLLSKLSPEQLRS